MEKGYGFMKRMEIRMFTKFKKYWAEFSTVMAIATILDSQYKFQFAEQAFKKVYGADHVIELSLLKDKLFCLFDEYLKGAKGSGSATNLPSSIGKASIV